VSLAAFDPQELQGFTRAFEDLFDTADPLSMTSYYTEHAQLMADGIQPIQGHDAITQFWRAAIARAAAARARRTIQLHESRSSGDLGYALCTVMVQIPPASDAPGASGTDIVVWDATIWQRDPDGTWRIAVDISTPLPPSG
jgi:ketosteroid isomerase-like protein